MTRTPAQAFVGLLWGVLGVAVPVLLALAGAALLVQAVGREPLVVLREVWDGVFRSPSRLASALDFWVPLALCALGLCLTFRGGQWNIGVEGQLAIGAVCAAGVALYVPAPAPLRVPLALAAAAGGGLLWALLVGTLKVRLGVHEIFGGVALNALAEVFTIWLVGSAWMPPGGNGITTGPFPAEGQLAPLASDLRVSGVMLALLAVAYVGVVLALARTRWGLQLRAVGRNARSALLLGVPTARVVLLAYMLCGALAGLAGANRVLLTYNTLRAGVGGGIGFLALLVVLVVGVRALLSAPVAFAFAAVLSGSTRLRLTQQLDASLAGVLQAGVVLLVLLFNGVRARLAPSAHPSAAAPNATPAPDGTPVTTEVASYE